MRELIEFQLSQRDVTDVLVSAQSGIWVDRGQGLESVASPRIVESQVRSLAVDLITSGNRHIDPVHPFTDVKLSGGLRVHAVLPPIATDGTVLSIRISRASRLRCDSLIESGFMTLGQLGLLRKSIQGHHNVLITGGAGVGKTTLLSALLNETPAKERIVTIEDVAELDLEHPNHVRLEARQANIEGKGAISVSDLIPQALRMRADRIVVGECRGTEWAPLLGAMNLGHGGGGTTVHANALQDVPGRLLALGFLNGMSLELSQHMLSGAFGLVAHLERGPHGRRIAQLGKIHTHHNMVEISPIT